MVNRYPVALVRIFFSPSFPIAQIPRDNPAAFPKMPIDMQSPLYMPKAPCHQKLGACRFPVCDSTFDSHTWGRMDHGSQHCLSTSAHIVPVQNVTAHIGTPSGQQRPGQPCKGLLPAAWHDPAPNLDHEWSPPTLPCRRLAPHSHILAGQ